MKKSATLLTIIAICGLLFALVSFEPNQASAGVFGIINSDMTWTKANSPYNLTGNVLVSKGATLTIEAGVKVNLHNYSIDVNGTLKAQGSKGNNIVIVSENLIFEKPTAGISLDVESTGCIIENTIFDATSLFSRNSLILNNNTFVNGEVYFPDGYINAPIKVFGSSTISNNAITGGLLIGDGTGYGLSLVINNTIIGKGIEVIGTSTVILNNIINGGPSGGEGINMGIYLVNPSTKAVISDNYISNYKQACIGVENGASAVIRRNIIESNMIKSEFTYNYGFFGIKVSGSSPLIENNTVTNSNVGLAIYNQNHKIGLAMVAKPTIKNNNIYNNYEYNLHLGFPDGFKNMIGSTSTGGNIDATYNWWGITDMQAINQTIHDSKNQYNLGTVNFHPFLTALNPQATPNPNAPIPSISQIPISRAWQATKDNGEKIDLIVNGNLTSHLFNIFITTNQSTATTTILFTGIGESGTVGFGNITIPKDSIPFPTKPLVFIDKQIAPDQGYTQDADNYYVWCTTNFNTREVSIVFGAISSSPTLISIIVPLVIIIVIATITILLYKQKKASVTNKHNHEEPLS